MAQQLGFNSKIIIFPEEVRGTAPTDFGATMTAHKNMSISSELGIETVTQVTRTGSLRPSPCDFQAGRKMPKVTLSGKLSKENAPWIFAGITLDTAKLGTTASPWKVDVQGSLYTFSILRLDTNQELADVYAGCVAETLTLSNSGVDINFEITFRAMTVTPAVNTSGWTGTEPVAVCEEQARFSVLAVTTGGLPTKWNTFSLTLTNEFAPDDQLFQNAATRSADTVISTNGQLSVNYNYDPATDYSSNVLDSTGVKTVGMGCAFTAADLVVFLGLKITNFTKTDPEKGIYTGDIECELIESATGNMFNATIE